jgi:hypothetical protein
MLRRRIPNDEQMCAILGVNLAQSELCCVGVVIQTAHNLGLALTRGESGKSDV